MAPRPNGGICHIRAQIMEEPPSGLTLQFVYVPGSDAPYRRRIKSDLPHGNREILFDHDGTEAGAGTALGGSCRLTWLREVTG